MSRPALPSAVSLSLLIWILSFGFFPLEARAVVGDLTGVVSGSDGKPIPETVITISNEESGEKVEAKSDQEGSFVIPLWDKNWKAGKHIITVTAPGGKSVTQSGFQLSDGANRVNLRTGTGLNITKSAAPNVVGDVTLTGLPPNTTISLTNEETKERVEQKTDDRGFVNIPLTEKKWQSGRHSVTCQVDGKPVTSRIFLRDGANRVDLTSLTYSAKPLDPAKAQKIDEALKKSSAILKADPKNSQALLTQGSALNRLGRHGEALSKLAQATKMGSTHPALAFETGWSLMRLGMYREAIAQLEKYEKMQPGLGQTSEFIGRSHLFMGELDKADGKFKEALQRDPRLASTVRFHQVILETLRKNPEAASKHIEALLKEAPNSATAQIFKNALLQAPGAKPAAGSPAKDFKLSDPIRIQLPPTTAGDVAGAVAKGVVGGLLGGLFGGGRRDEPQGPNLAAKPVLPETTLTSKDGKTKINLSGAIEDGRLVKQEKGGWETPWNIFRTQIKDPSEIPGIWKDFGGKPFEGIREVMSSFEPPPDIPFNPMDWNLITHATTDAGNNQILTAPFVTGLGTDQKNNLIFKPMERTVCEGAPPSAPLLANNLITFPWHMGPYAVTIAPPDPKNDTIGLIIGPPALYTFKHGFAFMEEPLDKRDSLGFASGNLPISVPPPGGPKVETPPGTIVKEETPPSHGDKIETLPDGTKIRIDSAGGREETRPDGTWIYTLPNGARWGLLPGGTKINTLPSGWSFEQHPDGTKIEHRPDGSREETRPDGSKIMTSTDGSSVEVAKDGSVTFNDPPQPTQVEQPALPQGYLFQSVPGLEDSIHSPLEVI